MRGPADIYQAVPLDSNSMCDQKKKTDDEAHCFISHLSSLVCFLGTLLAALDRIPALVPGGDTANEWKR